MERGKKSYSSVVSRSRRGRKGKLCLGGEANKEGKGGREEFGIGAGAARKLMLRNREKSGPAPSCRNRGISKENTLEIR